MGTLGRKHGARERAAVHAATAASGRAAEATRRSLERWTPIVAAMTALVTAYNVGFDRDVLSIVEDRSEPDRPVVTIHTDAEGAPSLVAALEGTLIAVRGRDSGGLSCHAECSLLPERTDAQTAAYVLQHWLERL